MKYVLAPHFRDGSVPAVFCGVNWSAAQYDLPRASVTGIVEVVPIEETLRVVREQFPKSRTLRVLSEDSVSERNNRALLDSKYRGLGFSPTYSLVRDFASWKTEFRRAQSDADVSYLPTNGGIQGWDDAEARRWVKASVRRPVATCDDFMMPYVAFGLTKVASEQGERAAEAALQILNGTPVSNLALERNRQVQCFVNPEIASRIGLTVPAALNCRVP